MRRPFAITLASLTLASLSIGITAPGCGPSALDVQDLCGWIADECNCYRRFAAGVANVDVATDAPKCGVVLDSAKNAIDPVTGATIEDETTKGTFGTFSSRDQLDICVLLRPQGGQVVFDPPIDVATLPLTTFGFKILDGSGDICATGSYAGITNFSIGFPEPAGTGGTGGAGTGGSGGGGGAAEQLCRTEGKPEDGDPAREPIVGGTFSMTPGDVSNIVETVCPNGEPHRFNLYQLNQCDGSDAGEDNFKALLPTAEIEADPGAANKDGYIRFRVFWPPTAADVDLDGAKPIAVEYFHCLIPGASLPCFDKALSDGETDVDCGGTCPQGCADGKDCLVGSDCASGVCETDAMGFLKCVSPPCGNLEVSGLETCDDGNTASGDGCSDTCQKEKGYNCNGPGKCVDIDECAENTDNCPVGTECENTDGSFTCDCEPGFTWDGMACVDGCGDGDLQAPEACDDGNTDEKDGCSANCTKETGYFCMGEGPDSCVDIDECATMADNCLDTEICDNDPGTFTCTCDQTIARVCDNVCTGILDDEYNCGDCDVVCTPNKDCIKGVCCTKPADDLCNDVCTDTQSDENNCGDCGKVCNGTCVTGTCCEVPNTACGTQCVNTQTSSSHCGACDNACGGGLSCVSGKCCAPPSNAVCGGACTDTMTDEANCGMCGKVCMAPTPTCNNGTCM